MRRSGKLDLAANNINTGEGIWKMKEMGNKVRPDRSKLINE